LYALDCGKTRMAWVEPCPTVDLGMEWPYPDGPERRGLADQRLLCAACQDVIGVYEPLVHVFGAFASHTSRAADPDVATADGVVYHAACYERLGE
jgi:hypothetical protein